MSVEGVESAESAERPERLRPSDGIGAGHASRLTWWMRATAGLGLVMVLQVGFGCGDDDRSSVSDAGLGGTGGTADTGGTAGTAGAGGTAGTGGGAEVPYQLPNPDADALRACDVPEPCSEVNVRFVKDTVEIDREAVGCVLDALAARTPGRYRYGTEGYWGNGNAGGIHTLVIGADGAVAHTRERFASLFPPDPSLPYPAEPSEECTLQAAAYFETCRAQLETLIEYEPEGQDGWRCIFGDGDRYTPSQLLWFERCEPASPAACE